MSTGEAGGAGGEKLLSLTDTKFQSNHFLQSKFSSLTKKLHK